MRSVIFKRKKLLLFWSIENKLQYFLIMPSFVILYSKNYSLTATFSIFSGIIKIHCILMKISLNYQNLAKI